MILLLVYFTIILILFIVLLQRMSLVNVRSFELNILSDNEMHSFLKIHDNLSKIKLIKNNLPRKPNLESKLHIAMVQKNIFLKTIISVASFRVLQISTSFSFRILENHCSHRFMRGRQYAANLLFTLLEKSDFILLLPCLFLIPFEKKFENTSLFCKLNKLGFVIVQNCRVICVEKDELDKPDELPMMKCKTIFTTHGSITIYLGNNYDMDMTRCISDEILYTIYPKNSKETGHNFPHKYDYFSSVEHILFEEKEEEEDEEPQNLIV